MARHTRTHTLSLSLPSKNHKPVSTMTTVFCEALWKLILPAHLPFEFVTTTRANATTLKPPEKKTYTQSNITVWCWCKFIIRFETIRFSLLVWVGSNYSNISCVYMFSSASHYCCYYCSMQIHFICVYCVFFLIRYRCILFILAHRTDFPKLQHSQNTCFVWIIPKNSIKGTFFSFLLLIGFIRLFIQCNTSPLSSEWNIIHAYALGTVPTEHGFRLYKINLKTQRILSSFKPYKGLGGTFRLYVVDTL